MFTGIVEEVGKVIALEEHSTGARLTIRLQYGARRCLRGIEHRGQRVLSDGARPHRKFLFGRPRAGDPEPHQSGGPEAGLARESRTSTGGQRPAERSYRSGSCGWHRRVNLVRTARRRQLVAEDSCAGRTRPASVFKGSISVDGISLTIASLEGDVLGITIIPHTVEATCLGEIQPGARLNLECDILAKHVEKLMALRAGSLG